MTSTIPAGTDVWVVEDHDQLRATLAELLRLGGARQVRTFAACEPALAALAAEAPPHLIILDIGLPGMSGLEAISHCKRAAPATDVILFSVFDDQARVFDALCAGASGYLVKSEPVERIIAAVAEVRNGGRPFSPEIARCVLDRFSRLRPSAGDSDLSERERGVIRLLADGLTKKEIATRLDISLHTVDNYVRRIYAKLHVNTLGGAVARALREGLV
jgi:DNA-binding NarL/FixJ family response regulator